MASATGGTQLIRLVSLLHTRGAFLIEKAKKLYRKAADPRGS